MELFLTLVSGVCWTWVYIGCVRAGLRDTTYAMPLWALSLNLAWELLYAYQGLIRPGSISAQTYVNIAWATGDVFIVYTYFRYGRRYWPKEFSQQSFVAWSVLVFAVGFVIQVLFLNEFGREAGARYSAFLQNLLMSVLFIDMFIRRPGLEGQSLSIGVSKWIGTLAPTVLFGWIEASFFILTLGVLCSVFDLIYIGLLWSRRSAMTTTSAAQVG